MPLIWRKRDRSARRALAASDDHRGGANLTGANLDFTFLIGANLTLATVTDATFADTIWDLSTTWPKGFHP